MTLTDTGENVQKWTQRHHAIFFSFFRRVRATSMTQRRVENTGVHFWTFSPVSVKAWKDERLTWNPYLYGQIFDLYIDIDEIWIPSIEIINLAAEVRDQRSLRFSTAQTLRVLNDGQGLNGKKLNFYSFQFIRLKTLYKVVFSGNNIWDLSPLVIWKLENILFMPRIAP